MSKTDKDEVVCKRCGHKAWEHTDKGCLHYHGNLGIFCPCSKTKEEVIQLSEKKGNPG